MSAKREWAVASELAVGTKVHRESMSMSMSTLRVSGVQIDRLFVGERYTHEARNKRGEVIRSHERIALVDHNGVKRDSVRPNDSVALGWPDA